MSCRDLRAEIKRLFMFFCLYLTEIMLQECGSSMNWEHNTGLTSLFTEPVYPLRYFTCIGGIITLHSCY